MNDIDIQIPYQFSPRPYQIPLFNAVKDGYKRAVAVFHRRAGKDLTCWNFTIKEACKRIGAYYYMLPSYTQSRKTIWDGIRDDGMRFLDHIPQEITQNINNTEMKIRLFNGSIIQLIGSDSYDTIMGSNPIGIVFSETALSDPRAWEFTRPILAENNGWAIFIGTPRGKNWFYELYKMAENNKDWFSQVLTVDDTEVISKEEIQKEREAGMLEDLIRQEFYCSFESSIPGAYYSNELRQAREQKRICDFPIESKIPVYTFWDLGIDGSTSIWFTQNVGREIHLVNYYENAGIGLVHYVNYLKDWRDSHNVTFAEHILPHDAKARQLQTGKSTIQNLSELGLICNITVRPARKEDGIEAVRQFFSRFWFNERNCNIGIEGISQYRREYSEIKGIYSVRPVHDKNSHPADALQTAALWYQKKEPAKEKENYARVLTLEGRTGRGRKYANPENAWQR